jgi:hypothetical protein
MPRARVGAVPEQNLERRAMIVLGGVVDRLAIVRFGAMDEQQLGERRMVRHAGVVERGDAARRVGAVGEREAVGVGPAREQQLDALPDPGGRRGAPAG